MKKNNGTLKDGQAVPAHYTSHAPKRNCSELASPVPQFGYFHGRQRSFVHPAQAIDFIEEKR
jgi:hypothetical protein